MNKALIFSAPSGAGKTTIVHSLLASGLPLAFSVSATSRSPRPNEEHGRDYFFFSSDEFKKQIQSDAFVEWEEVYENLFYGTLRSEVDRIWSENKALVFDVDVKGGINLKKHFGDQALAIFIQPPSLSVLESRLRNRHTEDETSLTRRLERAQFELSLANRFDRIVVNDDLELAVEETKSIVIEFLK